jgi:hypothetical protein
VGGNRLSLSTSGENSLGGLAVGIYTFLMNLLPPFSFVLKMEAAGSSGTLIPLHQTKLSRPRRLDLANHMTHVQLSERLDLADLGGHNFC